MVLAVQLQGKRQLEMAMRDFEQQIRGKDMPSVVRLAGNRAGGQARKICKPGKKMRKIVTRSSGAIGNEATNQRTDTVRWATHFIKFYRQTKKPFFVPISLSQFAITTADGGISPPKESQDFAKFESDRKRSGRTYRKSGLKRYQQIRTSTARRSRGAGIVKRYDTPTEVNKMRKIGRRGLAGELWAKMGNQAYSKRRTKLPVKMEGTGRITSKNRDAIKGLGNKYSKYSEDPSKYSFGVSLQENTAYIKKAYGDFTPYIYGKTAKAMRGMMKGILEDRAKKAQKRMLKVA